jgi:tripartite-type tricarboxylate transporter receptor subunit TctC
MDVIRFDRRFALAGALFAGMLLAGAPAFAQSYPTKTVRMIIPYPPGGGTDTMGRLLSQKLTELLGQQVVVDNRPGGGANIGTELAAKSPPDGYTLLLGTITNAIGASLYSKLNYDLVRDFAPVTLVATTPHILVVHLSVPVKTVKEFIAFTRPRPGQLAYSSSGSGTPSHLGAELFTHMTGAKMTHVPYKGGGPSVIALLSGEVSLAFATMPSVLQQVKSGKLRGLAVTTAKRSPSMPELPTIIEAGVPGYDVGSWYGVMVPTGTPREIIARLHTESHKLLKLPDVMQRMDATGFEALISTAEEFGVFVKNEVEKWAKVVKASGARAE